MNVRMYDNLKIVFSYVYYNIKADFMIFSRYFKIMQKIIARILKNNMVFIFNDSEILTYVYINILNTANFSKTISSTMSIYIL